MLACAIFMVQNYFVLSGSTFLFTVYLYLMSSASSSSLSKASWKIPLARKKDIFVALQVIKLRKKLSLVGNTETCINYLKQISTFISLVCVAGSLQLSPLKSVQNALFTWHVKHCVTPHFSSKALLSFT